MPRLDEFLPRSKQSLEVFDRDGALELAAERSIDPYGIGKSVFSTDRARSFLFLHAFHSRAIRTDMPPLIHDPLQARFARSSTFPSARPRASNCSEAYIRGAAFAGAIGLPPITADKIASCNFVAFQPVYRNLCLSPMPKTIKKSFSCSKNCQLDAVPGLGGKLRNGVCAEPSRKEGSKNE